MSTKYFNRVTIAMLICIFCVLGSCKKYLNQRPITDVSADVVFKDVESAYKALAGVYSRLVGDQGYGIRLSLYYTVDDDCIQGPSGNPDNDRRDIARYIATPGNLQLERPFNQLFQGIEFANICIEEIPKMAMYNNGSDIEKKQLRRMHGEALALRAQYYFEAIRNWGDLPAHFRPAAVLASTDPFPRRVDRDTLYNQIIEDLRIASELVPWQNELSTIGDPMNERLTKASIKALRARIALFRGGYSLRIEGSLKRNPDYLDFYNIARNECLDIINSGQHNLNPSFRSLWKDQVCAHATFDPHGELIFQASAIGRNSAEDTKLGYYNGPRVNNLGNSSYNPLPTYFYLFDSTDLRRDVTITPYFSAANGTTKIGQPLTNLTDGKYRRDWITNPTVSPTDAVQYFGLKWQIIRYADVLLMFAEADNEINNGPTAAAYNAANQIRRRGYGKAINAPDPAIDLPPGLNKATFFNAIVKERALELGGEGIRKYDLIRWNLLATKIAETKAALQLMYARQAPYNNLPDSMYYRNNNTSDNSSLWFNSFYTPKPSPTPAGTTRVVWVHAALNAGVFARYATGFSTGKSELLPIPTAARTANANFTQNPGY
jgi:starch-binding outer membrane protein, SusD/RagB family